ncbi:hypothetical protein GCM10009558_098580 [Virgisporangium aurantiacum]
MPLAVGTLVVLGVAVGGLVGWSILNGQGFLPNWGWLPAAPWSAEPPPGA